MAKRIFILLLILVAPFVGNAQNFKNIQLKQEKVDYHPKGFYIAEVVNETADANSIGTVKVNGKKAPVALQNGTVSALKQFIDNNVAQDRNTQAASLHITRLDFEIKKQDTVWTVNANAVLTFFVSDKKILEYITRGEMQTDKDPAFNVESFIRKSIAADLKKFDDWWAQNKGRVPILSDVKVNVIMATTTTKPNSIVYSARRPLSISDFKGFPQGAGNELAVTESGIGLGYSATAENSQVVVDVTITPYFNKADSWFKEAGKNARVLAHEQTHFDITAIKACELIQTIRNTKFTQDNYVKLLEELQMKNAEESNEEEQRYDRETNHGIIHDAQEAWEKKIKEQVKAVGCYL